MSITSNSEKKVTKFPFWIIPIIALVVYIMFLYIVQPIDPNIATHIEAVQLIILAGIAAVLFALVSRHFKWLSTKPGQTALIIAIGIVIFTIAESIYYGYELLVISGTLSEVPDPSIADIFYISGYIPFMTALWLNIRTIKMQFTRSIFLLWIALSIGATIAIGLFVAFPLIGAEITLAEIVYAIYPLEDLVLIILILVIILKFKSGEISRPWMVLIAGIIVEAIGDLYYYYVEELAVYNFYDFCFAIEYILYIASALYFLWLYKKQ